MGVQITVPFDSEKVSIFNIRDINSSFAYGSLKVMYLGDNRNKTHFSKDNVKRALPSLRNVPIVCHYDDTTGEIGGHDVELVRNAKGDLKLKNLTEPCGVVPEHAKFEFIKDCDDEGTEHEYLLIDDVILWKRQYVFKHISDDLGGVVNHSMEITGNESRELPNGFTDITDFEFTALCLLESCEPCFQGSELELYSAQNFKQKMEQMMSELKTSFKPNENNQVVSADRYDDKQIYTTKGGEREMDKNELIAKYEIDIENLNFSIDDFSVEELEAKFKEMQKQSDPKNNNANNFALTSNIVNEIRRSLDTVKVQTEWGESNRYWFVDCDFEVGEIYCWDSNDWLLYGFAYTMDGDKIVIDFESKKRKKYTISDFDEGEQSSPIADVFELINQKFAENAEFKEKYSEASAQIEQMNKELKELKEFKQNTLDIEASAEREKLFSKFEDLSGDESFEALKESSDKLSIDALEEKCYAIRGRKSNICFSAKTSGAPRVITPRVEKDFNLPYGGIFEKYGIKAEN